jgi:hypothetical protein
MQKLTNTIGPEIIIVAALVLWCFLGVLCVYNYHKARHARRLKHLYNQQEKQFDKFIKEIEDEQRNEGN